MLGESCKPVSLSAYTHLLQKHLPPVDTVDAIWKTESGVSGTFSLSFGSTLSGTDFTIACEKGSVSVVKNKVIVRQGEESEDNFTEKEFNDQANGVTQEVLAWGKALAAGKPNADQSPEEALADLEVLEKMLRSGEQEGATQSLQYQV